MRWACAARHRPITRKYACYSSSGRIGPARHPRASGAIVMGSTCGEISNPERFNAGALARGNAALGGKGLAGAPPVLLDKIKGSGKGNGGLPKVLDPGTVSV